MVAKSSLSIAANELRSLLHSNITDLAIDQIKIGPPKHTFDEMTATVNNLNLFFYNIQYDGYPSDGMSGDPFYVRLYCLITAVGVKTGNLSPGENDLRLVGEVMRVLHEKSTVSVNDAVSGMLAELQIVPHPLNLDNLNHIWSTQGDTAYRLSVAYEMALAPIPLSLAIQRSPLVAESGMAIQAELGSVALPESGYGLATAAPVVPKFSVDVTKQNWSPHICIVNIAESSLAYTLTVPTTILPGSGFMPLAVMIAGKSTEPVDLVWESWTPSSGWVKSGVTQNEIIHIDSVDPETLFNPFDPDLAREILLPIQDKGQALLYAERVWTRPDGSAQTLRSNLLLVTVYEANA